MPAVFDHSVILARDALASARFLARALDVPAPTGPANIPEEAKGAIPAFVTLTLPGNSFDFVPMPADYVIPSQHLGFRLSEQEFDAAIARFKADGVQFFAHETPAGIGGIGEVYKYPDGTRVLYFKDPNNHLMELTTINQHDKWK